MKLMYVKINVNHNQRERIFTELYLCHGIGLLCLVVIVGHIGSPIAEQIMLILETSSEMNKNVGCLICFSKYRD